MSKKGKTGNEKKGKKKKEEETETAPAVSSPSTDPWLTAPGCALPLPTSQPTGQT